ncbi:42925_t:CDS:1, partial [Gigaspora margarita]
MSNILDLSIDTINNLKTEINELELKIINLSVDNVKLVKEIGTLHQNLYEKEEKLEKLLKLQGYELNSVLSETRIKDLTHQIEHISKENTNLKTITNLKKIDLTIENIKLKDEIQAKDLKLLQYQDYKINKSLLDIEKKELKNLSQSVENLYFWKILL